MSIFEKIKDAIFGHEAPARTPPPAVDTTLHPGAESDTAAASVTATHADGRGTTANPIDVENHLDSLPGADRLNWRTSIVDLMKLIGVPSDHESRAALAHELGRADYSGSADDNVWLHQCTMRELAQTGGRVPEELLD